MDVVFIILEILFGAFILFALIMTILERIGKRK